MKKNTIKLSTLRKIIHEEIRRSIIIEAREIFESAIGETVLREAFDSIKQSQKARAGGYGGKFVDVPSSTSSKQDVQQMLNVVMNLFDNAVRKGDANLEPLITQLQNLYTVLKTSGNQKMATTWLTGVGQALEKLKSIGQQPSQQRNNRIKLAQNEFMKLGGAGTAVDMPQN